MQKMEIEMALVPLVETYIEERVALKEFDLRRVARAYLELVGVGPGRYPERLSYYGFLKALRIPRPSLAHLDREHVNGYHDFLESYCGAVRAQAGLREVRGLYQWCADRGLFREPVSPPRLLYPEPRPVHRINLRLKRA